MQSYEYIDRRLSEEGYDKFRVSRTLDLISGFYVATRPLWRGIAKLENAFWDEELENTKITNPVYICGLARSGTTILLNKLYETGIFASHSYTDYPFIDMPLIWHKWLSFTQQAAMISAERTHLDRIQVSAQSPEALEEMIWESFFTNSHNQETDNVIDPHSRHPAFETYYRYHLKKIMRAYQKSRYLTKGNYNITRMGYIRKIIPDARFLVTIRRPEDHIASLMKQHYLLCKVHTHDKKSLRYMQRIGHYEFGLDRRIINTGNTNTVHAIQECWQKGEDVKGWALYYKSVHDWLYKHLQDAPELAAAVKIIPYETLCAAPENVMNAIAGFIDIPYKATLAENLSAPNYYEPAFTKEESAIIQDIALPSYELLKP